MYLLIMAGILGVILAIVFAKKSEMGWFSVFLGPMLGVLFFVLSLLVIQLPVHLCSKYNTAVKVYEYPLVAVRDGQGVRGSFFLGTGTVNSHEYYVMFRQHPDGAIEKIVLEDDQYCRDRFYIYEIEEDEEPRVVLYKFTQSTFPEWTIISEPKHEWNMYVPKGTVVRNFKIQ